VNENRARAVLTYAGHVADRNDRGITGACLVGRELAARLGARQDVRTDDAPATSSGWRADLAQAFPGLTRLQTAHFAALADLHTVFTTLPRCTSALATLPNLSSRPGVRIVWLDAHGDLNTPASTPTGYLGGMVLSAALGWWDSGLGGGLLPEDVLLVGARDLDPFERGLVDDGMISLASGPAMLDTLDAFVADRPVYVHLDCDVLELGIVPTAYEVRGGLSLADLHAVARRVGRNEVVGVEIAEVEASGADPAGAVGRLLDALEPLT